MTYTVSITSQGQISIPAKLRRKLGFHKKQKALVTEERGQLLVRPIKDVLELEGAFKTDKKIDFRAIREGFGQHLAQEGMKGTPRSILKKLGLSKEDMDRITP